MECIISALVDNLVAVVFSAVGLAGLMCRKWIARRCRRRRRRLVKAVEYIRKLRHGRGEVGELRRQNKTLLLRVDELEAQLRKLQPDKLLKKSDLHEDCLALLEALAAGNGAAMFETLEAAFGMTRVQLVGVLARLKEFNLVVARSEAGIPVAALSRFGLARLQEWGMLSVR